MSHGLTAAGGFHRFFEQAPGGDIITARSFAVGLLRDGGLPPNLDPHCRLVLTAALLHLQGQSGAPATRSDVFGLLERLRDPAGAAETLGRSPMQLVRYAEIEIVEFSSRLRAEVIEGCLRVVRALPYPE